MSKVHVDRFCSIEGAICKKEFCSKGEKSFFIAYPYSPHWQSFYSELIRELGKENKGYVVDRWEDSVKNDLLFSKVCEGIHSHSFLLAEVTEPNPNVSVEIGYALAVGRMPILRTNDPGCCFPGDQILEIALGQESERPTLDQDVRVLVRPMYLM